MSKFFYARLAFQNIRKNRRIYLPYILTCIITISFYYILKSLSLNEGLKKLMGAETISYILESGSNVIMIFSGIFLLYTNSFLRKQRQKEFGLFHILGMEKRHLQKMMAAESIYVGLISMVLGIAAGVALDRAAYLLIFRIVRVEVPMKFYFSTHALTSSIAVFSGIFFIIWLWSVIGLARSKPIDLIKGGNVGEKEPKAKYLLALLGLLALGAGYRISLTTKNPVAAVSLFFVAVMLVIIGTYLLFTAGSIVLLKILRANRHYYYQTKHFIGISGLLYRMKQNAVGLANICILSTMVLVMVSATVSLMVGVEDLITSRYPYEICFYEDRDTYEPEGDVELYKAVNEVLEEKQCKKKKEASYEFLALEVLEDGDDLKLFTKKNVENVADIVNSAVMVNVISLDNFNRITGQKQTLQNGEVLLFCNRKNLKQEEISLGGLTYRVAGIPKQFDVAGSVVMDVFSTYSIIVDSEEEVKRIELYLETVLADVQQNLNIKYMYGFDMKGTDEEIADTYAGIMARLDENPTLLTSGYGECRSKNRDSFYTLYGGLFFIGILLGLLFSAGTILIIYYKQISEGYYDKDRYIIMQNIGMSKKDVKASIRSQVQTVFFLPLVMAGIHLLFASPILLRIMDIMNMTNHRMFILCTIGCYLVFGILYMIVFGWTNQVYYGIVVISRVD